MYSAPIVIIITTALTVGYTVFILYKALLSMEYCVLQGLFYW